MSDAKKMLYCEPKADFVEKAKEAIGNFDKTFSQRTRDQTHVTVGNDTITWEMITGNYEIITKTLNVRTGEVEYLYLRERNSKDYYLMTEQLEPKENW